ncbi:MAG: serine/threonine protein kinase [candidate division Zixibacteria bacterium]|nr:serine/threonine protein kinase [Candidatus Tariuqbacter arcticus]
MDALKALGQYEIFEEISHGSITTIYKAYQPSLKRTVLIKKLHRKLVSEPDIRERFYREAQVCAQISHPNIVAVYDFHSSVEAAYLVLEYIPGKNLAELMANEPLPLEVAFIIMLEIFRGLEYAHEMGVVHRDMKPDNIMISESAQVKVSDFGLAALEGATTLTRQGMVVGTPAYMSPEQAAGKKVDKRSDIFSLGVTFFEMLTGINVYKADSLTECIRKIISDPAPRLSDYRVDLPIQLEKLLNKMLQKNPAKRADNCGELFEELESIAVNADMTPDKKYLKGFIQKREEYSTTSIRVSTSTARRRFRLNTVYLVLGVLIVIIALVMVIRYNLFPQEDEITESITADAGDISGVSDTSAMAALMNIIDSTEEDIHQGDEETTPESNDLGIESPQEEYSRSAEDLAEEIVPPSKETVIEHPLESANEGSEEDNIPEAVEAVSIPGLLTITCFPWADVYLDERLLGQPPFAKPFEVLPGEHTLYFTRPDYPLVNKIVDVKPGEKLNIEMNLWNHLGVLKISTVNTWAEIWVDGMLVDRTPRADPLVLSLGEHTIELKNPDYKTWEKVIKFDLGSEEPIVMAVALDPL